MVAGPVHWLMTTATWFQGPQAGVEPGCLGLSEQCPFDAGKLGGGQLGVWAGRPAAARSVYAALLEASPSASCGRLPGRSPGRHN
jgi:hypothetical protein